MRFRYYGRRAPLGLAFFGLLSSGAAYSDSLNEIQIFRRCYGLITNSSVPPNHFALTQVTSGLWNAKTACLYVLDKATLIASGANEGRTVGEINPSQPTDAADALNILRTFHFFHRKWFSKENLHEGMNFHFRNVLEDFVSPYEAANHVSRLLHSPSAQYRELVRGVRSVREIRTHPNHTFLNPDTNPMGRYFGQQITYQAGYPISGPLSQFFHNWRTGLVNNQNVITSVEFFDPVLNDLGPLKGFRVLNPSEMENIIVAAFTSNANNADGSNYSNLYEHTFYTDNLEVKWRKPYGGGVLGTQSYLISNLGAGSRNNGYPRSNGGDVVWRGGARNIYSDFMCRTLPTLTADDAVPFVRSSGPHPWMGNASCMGCHATVDGMAGALRNFALNGDRNFKGVPENFTPQPDDLSHYALVVEHPTAWIDSASKRRRMKRDGIAVSYASAEADLFGIGSDNLYFRRPPRGKILTRDYANQLISQDVEGVEALGEGISNVDDFYICAARRYFQFFTGFEASLPDLPNSSPKEIEARNFVIELGLSLKSHQSLRTLISEIIESDFFKGGFE